MALLEVCVERASDALVAERGGAQRVELCADLAADGLTPSEAEMRAARALCSIPIFAMIRPVSGAFRCDRDVVSRMEREIDVARDAGVNGLVLGALDERGAVDIATVERLVTRARDLPVTFHRAFDRTPDPAVALELLVDLGVARVLTSGHAPTACEGEEELALLVRRAGDRIVVMPGGGVRASNARDLYRRTGARELHSSVSGGEPLSEEAVRALAASLAD